MDSKFDLKVQIEHYAQQVADGHMDFSAVRKVLKTQIMDEKEMNQILRRVDKRSLRIKELKGIHARGKASTMLGIVLVILGILLPFLYKFYVLHSVHVAVYGGPFLVGTFLIWYGRNDRNRY